MALNHLHLKVVDLERSQRFYERWFGFRHRCDHGPIRFLRDDAGMDLALAPGAVEPLPAWFHFGFRLEGPEAVRALRSSLAEAGEALVEGAFWDEPDLVAFRCRDPDGHPIEVYWEPDPAPAR